jgi:hypothetical protein
VWIRTQKADELFATLRPDMHSPAVWIVEPQLSFLTITFMKHRKTTSLEFVFRLLPGDPKAGRGFRHTATHDERSCRVDPTLPGACAPSILGPGTKGG